MNHRRRHGQIPDLEEILEMSATEYTDCPAHDKGGRRMRPKHAEPAKGKIEVVAIPEVALRILEPISRNYFDKSAMIPS